MKKLAGSMIRSNSKLYNICRDQIISYDRYQTGELKVIGLPGLLHTDTIVRTKFSYADWVNNHSKYSVIKVEGLETMIDTFRQFNPRDIHLFVSNKTSFSFKWHKDDVNVFLYVIKGYKKLQVKSKTYFLTAGQGALIPKGHLHRAFSKKGTWALSVGY